LKKIVPFIVLLAVFGFILACATAEPVAQPAGEPAPQPAPSQPAPQPQPAQPAPQPPPAQPAPAPVSPSDIILEGAQTYAVTRGDIISTIAIKYYGASNMYYFPLILAANTNITDPDRIYPGMRITVPDLQRNLNNAGARAKLRSAVSDAAAYYERKGQLTARDELRKLAQSL
jgi:phage tail protein X